MTSKWGKAVRHLAQGKAGGMGRQPILPMTRRTAPVRSRAVRASGVRCGVQWPGLPAEDRVHQLREPATSQHCFRTAEFEAAPTRPGPLRTPNDFHGRRDQRHDGRSSCVWTTIPGGILKPHVAPPGKKCSGHRS
ncbi:hypothetical protein GCM10010341_50310 [Streptomyces noursei]|nr:hypothetical protein GCM10010341_50310 [Streptomyces noursei]